MINSFRKTVIAGMLLSLYCLPSLEAATSEPGNPAKATLKSSALVSQSEIRADCLIKADCDTALRHELAEIQLGHIPDPLGELIISEKELAGKLGLFAGRLQLPKKVIIKRQGAFLKGSDVIARIKKICNPENHADLEIDSSRIPANIILPGNLKSWELKANSDNRLGMRLLSLTAETDGGSFRQLIQISVARIIEAASLTRLAKPGELISADMIGKKRVELKSEQTNMPMTYEEAIGKCLTRYKSAGTILRSSDLSTDNNSICIDKFKSNRKKSFNVPVLRSNDRSNWVIKPGDSVDFRFANGTLELSFPARAIEGGEIGDQINLINLKNQKKVQGIITDKGHVEYAKN